MSTQPALCEMIGIFPEQLRPGRMKRCGPREIAAGCVRHIRDDVPDPTSHFDCCSASKGQKHDPAGINAINDQVGHSVRAMVFVLPVPAPAMTPTGPLRNGKLPGTP
jgi:hypothetical protein